jgi:SAM-dependent methyltransferase
MDPDLVDYYSRRSGELEKVYDKPERQEDLERLRHFLMATCKGQAVLEIACGTGYWTKLLAESAESVTGLDASPVMLDLARKKLASAKNVELIAGDAFAMPVFSRKFTACCAMFLLSHIRRNELRGLLDHIESALPSGTILIFADNAFVHQSNTPIAETSDIGDTYQERSLPDGSRHRVLKNFYSVHELKSIFEPRGHVLQIMDLQYYWLVSYQLIAHEELFL